MAYLRILSSYIPPAQKRLIVQHLLEIAPRALAEDRHRINIQFILLPHIGSVAGFGPAIPNDADFFLEVNYNGLSEEKKKAFADEIKPLLTEALGTKRGTRFTRLFGITLGTSRQVALLFNEAIPEGSTSRA